MLAREEIQATYDALAKGVPVPLVLDYQGTKNLYQRCADVDLVMARIGYSDQDQIHGIVRGAAKFAKENSISQLPIGLFSTVGHYIFQQLPRYLLADHQLPSQGGDPKKYRDRLYRNARLAKSFMEILTDASDPDFGSVFVTHHYDHGHYTLPGGQRSEDELLYDPEFLDFFSSVMFDDTASPFQENIDHSIAYREFLETAGRRKVLEGCLEEVAAGGHGLTGTKLTGPEQIQEYLERTEFELVVPNIGTESINARQVGVEWSVLEALKERRVGHRLVVHGFSSIRKLAPRDQQRLGECGVVGMNAWSYIPQSIGPELLELASRIHAARTEDNRYPIDWDENGEPLFDRSGDANVFFTPILDKVRDVKVRRIAESVYEILMNLGYDRLR